MHRASQIAVIDQRDVPSAPVSSVVDDRVGSLPALWHLSADVNESPFAFCTCSLSNPGQALLTPSIEAGVHWHTANVELVSFDCSSSGPVAPHLDDCGLVSLQ